MPGVVYHLFIFNSREADMKAKVNNSMLVLITATLLILVGCKGVSKTPGSPTPIPDPTSPPPSLNCDERGEIKLNDYVFLVVKETVPPCGSEVRVGTVPRMVFEVTHIETSLWEKIGFSVVPLRDSRNSFPWPEWRYWSKYTRDLPRGQTIISQVVDTPWDPLITGAMIGPIEYLGVFAQRKAGEGTWQDGPNGSGCKWDMIASPEISMPNKCNYGQNTVRVNWTIVP